MNKLIALAIGVVAVALSAFTTPGKPVSANVDTKSSYINWKAYKVTGQHEGRLQLKNGKLNFKDNVLTSGSFEIDMKTISCTDLTGGSAEKLIGHLKSEDFFNVANHPIAKFETTQVISRGTPGAYKMIGNLTIKGITKTIKFNADLKEDGGKVTATAKVTVDRADFDIRFGSGSFFDNLGDKTIYDEFDLNVNLVASK
jgi:polyisoprenoid-binding protein YceI